ncbi:PREDICTED: disintegrin and metalloproteinase domain-containing protein 1a-like [Elephantulus edwardii]|uniref:disintegrin and metalloproteinase domain-containing protein 1a-like n=1 Tax=Elephantulus edwardii TaxID=28737 RepID=UPI0003F0C834|nr:PREDICTED: disintegrin and metalloproteinase domain-containing protein 1a-like [Elephantulus edwardii]
MEWALEIDLHAPGSGTFWMGRASYTLSIQGQKQVIHLKVKKGYFVSNFPVFSYHNGILGQETPSLSHDCYSEGYIEGVPGSFVSVSTCSGLKGILIKEEQFYGIEPLESSEKFEHKLYTMAQPAPVSCGVTSRVSQGVPIHQQQGGRKPPHPKILSSLWSQPKYVEMFVVVNHRRFQLWGSNINETIQGVMGTIALANIFTKAINTEVVLAGMEIWTEGDLIEVPVDLQGTLSNFNSWRQQELASRVQHDVAHMIVGHQPGQTTGQAFLSGACSSGFAAAVEAFHHDDVLLFAALMAHELGHNLGIQHDHAACICKEKYFCLMHENITKEGGFSNCSSQAFSRFLHELQGECLFNKPGPVARQRRSSTCGNGVVEETEECDCGPTCDSHPCCDPLCKLNADAQCSQGLCCSECQFRRRGHTCRPSGDECDLPEYCDGESAECPADTYKQDGTSCEEGNYCFQGQCKNPDRQCVSIYGMFARSASEHCYLSMNSKGDRFGNCGRPSEMEPVHARCIGDDIFCGKLVCTDVTQLPTIKSTYTLIQVPYLDGWCWSMDASDGANISDKGDVQNGTYCAPHKVCMNHACVAHTVLNYDCEPAEMCNGKGICNHLRHCHCDEGFAPPDCIAPGVGGSVDSGPPPNTNGLNPILQERINDNSGVTTVDRVDKDENESLGNIVYILPLFLIAVFLGLLILAIFSGRRWSLKTQGVSAENISEEASDTQPEAVEYVANVGPKDSGLEDEGRKGEEQPEVEQKHLEEMPSMGNRATEAPRHKAAVGTDGSGLDLDSEETF